jgi:hypothetical protein
MTVRSLYPSDRPNLLLNFARARAIDTRVSFTRASAGTYVGTDGLIKTAKINEARFDSNPITGEGIGLIVEEARTNALVRSEDLGNAAWSKTNLTVTSNAVTSPSGALDGDTIIPSATNTYKSLDIDITVSEGVTHGFSFFAKPAGYNFLVISQYVVNNGGDGGFCVVDLANGTLTQSISTSIGGFVFLNKQSFANGWAKFSLSFVFNFINSSSLRFCPVPTSTPTILETVGTDHGRPIFTGDGTSGVSLWGVQAEPGARPSSYIPTGASSVTRAADVVTLEEPHFSNIWNPSGGTFLINYTSPAAGINPILSVDNNTTSNRIELYTSGTNQKFTVTSGGATQCDLTTGTVAANTIYRLSAAYASNDFSSVLNGAAPVTAGTGTVPTANRLRIGSNQAGNFAVSTIARIAYYPNRYPNTQLRGLTTT